MSNTIFQYLVTGSLFYLTAMASAFPLMESVQQGGVDCFECHGRRGLMKKLDEGREISLFVNRADLHKSVHKGLSCIDCHPDAKSIPHPKLLRPVDCSRCHEESEDYQESIHGKAFSQGDRQAPSCTICHGEHNIVAVNNPQSSVARSRISEICISCHEDEEIVSRHELPEPAEIKLYEKSVHGSIIKGDSTYTAAVCIDCHGTHKIEPSDDPRSETFKPHIPEVCGKCHGDIASEYAKSVHGTAIAGGILDAPVCTDCHGEHSITAPTDPTSKVAPKNIPKTCSACHEDMALAKKYGFPARRYTTYLNSYHGVANKYGKTVVANCASCHGIHDILPASAPESRINPVNLPDTCGGCHPGAGKNILVGGKIHVEATPESSPGTYYVRKFYTWFISILMIGFILYIIVETYGRLRRRHTEK
ncbi:MAG: cytochrome c3 family protein [bacterium]